MQSFSIKIDPEQVSYQAGQWSLNISQESGVVTDRNIQTAVTGPKQGEPIEAFFSFSKEPGKNYDAGKFIQEPDLAFPIIVKEPVLKDGLFQFDSAGDLVTADVAKRLVGFILIDEDREKILGRGSWSNLAIFSKKDYDFDSNTGILKIENDYYRLVQTIEADKNRLDGVAGTFVKIDPTNIGESYAPVVNFELGIVASIVLPTHADQIKALKAMKSGSN